MIYIFIILLAGIGVSNTEAKTTGDCTSLKGCTGTDHGWHRSCELLVLALVFSEICLSLVVPKIEWDT
jgi:hypothetical protein